MNAKTPKRFVAVGHCGPDAAMLGSALRRALPGATLTAVNDDAALDAHRDGDAVWLVNRLLDGDFADEDGIALLAREAARGHGATLLLISNLDEAQESARAAGARRGFGKLALHRPETTELLRSLGGA